MNSHPATKYKHVPNDVEKNNFSSGLSRRQKKLVEKRIDLKNLTKKIPEKKIKVKVSTRIGRRSAHTCCTAQEKRLTRKILQEQC